MLTKSILGIFFFLVLSASSIGTQYWPTTKWEKSSPHAQGFEPKSIHEMFQFMQKRKFPIDSVVIVKNGYLIGEFYAKDNNEKTISNIYSITKSFTSALVGIAIDKGLIKSEEQTLGSIFSKNKIIKNDPLLKDIRVQHLLTMTSGLKTRDNHLSNYSGIFTLRSSKNWVDYILSLGTEKKPGEFYNYSNGSSHILAAILAKVTEVPVAKYAERNLFSHIGIKNYKWPKDPQGINHGYSNLQLSARDMAKLGILYLNKGKWDKRQIISSSWIEKSLKKHSYPNKDRYNPFSLYPFNGYGYQWWNSETAWKADLSYRKAWGMGSDTAEQPEYYLALGYEGQYVFILPHHNMVVVFKSRFEKERDILIPKAIVEEFLLN
jgi:CubicO group peptidase (beta-lactamase class C family)